MRITTKLKQIFLNFNYGKMIFTTTVAFSLLYHTVFLVVFKLMGIEPLYWYNYFSVSLFFTVLVLSPRFKSMTKPYAFCFAEVIIHQLLADYFVGGEAAFHYFILLIGLLPALCFKEKFKKALIYGIFSTVLFLVLETLSPYITPRFDTPASSIAIIRIINISLVAVVILVGLSLYSYMLYFYEQNLENQVSEKTDEITTQNNQLIRLQNHLIVSLSSLVENRDTDTGDHIKKTSAYCALIARKAFENGVYPEVINEDFIVLIERAAPMHDIGKILVPDAVLKKTGRFTPEEFELMKLHTTKGIQIINEVIGISEDKAFVKMAIDVAANHHERWDGTGYPFKVQGEDIPVSGRIMAIADVYDALVSERCYKKAMPSDEALEIIRQDAGTHFDPVLATLFLNAKEEVLTIQNSLLSASV